KSPSRRPKGSRWSTKEGDGAWFVWSCLPDDTPGGRDFFAAPALGRNLWSATRPPRARRPFRSAPHGHRGQLLGPHESRNRVPCRVRAREVVDHEHLGPPRRGTTRAGPSRLPIGAAAARAGSNVSSFTSPWYAALAHESRVFCRARALGARLQR